jgi:N-glycosylase/DNA lyase
MNELISVLTKVMNQKPDAKTIVFAVKMFSYSARNIF